MNSTATVFLVDDESTVLRGLTRLIAANGLQVEGFSSPQAFLTQYDPERPGCAIFDLSMQSMDGIQLQQALGERGDHRPIIFLTGRGDIPSSVNAMKGGAVDFLTKPVDADALLRAIDLAIKLDREIREKRKIVDQTDQLLRGLTRRERDVMAHVAQGRLNKQIAASLGITEKTVKVHRGRVMAKLRIRSVAQLVRMTQQIEKPAIN